MEYKVIKFGDMRLRKTKGGKVLIKNTDKEVVEVPEWVVATAIELIFINAPTD